MTKQKKEENKAQINQQSRNNVFHVPTSQSAKNYR